MEKRTYSLQKSTQVCYFSKKVFCSSLYIYIAVWDRILWREVWKFSLVLKNRNQKFWMLMNFSLLLMFTSFVGLWTVTFAVVQIESSLLSCFFCCHGFLLAFPPGWLSFVRWGVLFVSLIWFAIVLIFSFLTLKTNVEVCTAFYFPVGNSLSFFLLYFCVH